MTTTDSESRRPRAAPPCYGVSFVVVLLGKKKKKKNQKAA